MAGRNERIRFSPRYPKVPATRAYGRSTSPLDDLYHYVLTRSWSALLALECAAFLAANLLFAWLYTLDPSSISEARPGSLADAFFFSVQTMATIGYGAMHPATTWANVLVTLEAMLGILGTAMVTGLTFARFARPTARVLWAERAVIGPRDGAPHLMFRLANWRHNDIMEARLQVVLLVAETTQEGEQVRRMIELPLVIDHTPIFTMTWTAMHRIDESSPFFGVGALQRLKGSAGELFLSLQGIDDTFNTEVHARHRYRMDDIVVGGRFENVLTIRPDGTREIDYRYFHTVLPVHEHHEPQPERDTLS